MQNDEQMIAAAIAAGRVRYIPAGITIADPRWAAHAALHPLKTMMGKRVFTALQNNPNKAMSAKEIVSWMSARHFASTSPVDLDRYERVKAALAMLEHHKMATVSQADGKSPRWKLKGDPDRFPRLTFTELAEESRRLKARKVYLRSRAERTAESFFALEA